MYYIFDDANKTVEAYNILKLETAIEQVKILSKENPDRTYSILERIGFARSAVEISLELFNAQDEKAVK